jgi:type I restriction enzyme S subunit
MPRELWPRLSLSRLTKSIDYGVTASARTDEVGPKFLRITDIQLGMVNWQTVPYCECSESEVHSCSLAQGDIVFARTGATTGKSFLIREALAEEAVFASYLIRVRPNDDVDPVYLYWYFQTPDYWSQISRGATGTAQQGVNSSKLKELGVPVPPIEDQHRIAAILDKADAIRRKRCDCLALTTELLRSAFLDVFGEPGTNAKGWPVLRTGDLFPAQRAGTRCGPFGSALKKNEYESSGIPVWGIDNVVADRFVEEGSLFISEAKFEALQGYAVVDGDILISRAGTVGRMCVARPRAKRSIIGTNLIRVSLDSAKVMPEYFTMLLTLFGSQITRLKANSKEDAYSFLNTGALKELEIPVPDMRTQQAFFAWVEGVRKVQTRMETALSETDHLFNSLVQHAFSGELVSELS